MSSRTEKIMDLARKSLNANELTTPSQTVTCDDISNIIEAGTYVIDEHGDVVKMFSEIVEMTLEGTHCDSFESFPKSLNYSEVEAFSAVEQLEQHNYISENLYSLSETIQSQEQSAQELILKAHENVTKDTSQLSQDENSGQNIFVVAEVYNEKTQLPKPETLCGNTLVTVVNNQVSTSENEKYVNNLNVITVETEEGNSILNNTQSEEEIQEAVNHDKDISEDTILKPKRRKRHQVSEEDWECKKARILREQGKEYKGRKVIDGKISGFVNRPKRKMKAITCKCTGKTFRCKSITETEREKLFNNFWNLCWKERKMLIKSTTDVNLTQRSRDRINETNSRRKFSFKYHLNVHRSKVRVCKKTLLATFGLNEWMVNHWLEDGAEVHEELTEEEGIDERTEKKRQPKGITRQEDLSKRLSLMKDFLLSLPQVESHYCRASSQKLYLESWWTSKAQLFQFYSENWCKEQTCKPLSSCTFYKTFEDLNLSLYRPKKDQCDVCRAHKLKHITDEEFNEHVTKKIAARQEKDRDKKMEEHVYTVDLQSLLLCPKSNASALYYRRKLSVHNLCMYDLRTHDGYCYLWNESEGELTANEFASILSNFIESLLPLRKNATKIVMYSDGCNYQNRSAILSNALLHLSVKHKITIESKYLEKGHTQMECDSMHSTIERHLRLRDINVPADYVDVCKNARKNPRPYKVTYLEHSFFKNYSKPLMYKSIRPGLKEGDARVTDIRCLKYSDDGKISYKINYNDEYKLLPACIEKPEQSGEASRKSRRNKHDPGHSSSHSIEKIQLFREAHFPSLYESTIKITEAKFKHLQELKMTLPGDYHSFYEKLQY